MEAMEKAGQVENSESVISVLSTPKSEKKPAGARITFLAAHKALHLGIRTQASGSQKYVVVRRPAGSTKVCVVTLCDVARGEKEALKLARAVNADMDRGVNPNEKKKASRDAERKEQLKAKHSFLSVGESYIARLKRRGKSDITIEQFTRMLRCADLAPWHARPISDIRIGSRNHARQGARPGADARRPALWLPALHARLRPQDSRAGRRSASALRQGRAP